VVEALLDAQRASLPDLPEALAAWRRKPTGTAAGRVLLDAAATRADSESWSVETERINEFSRQRDRAGLAAYLRDETQLSRDRLRAASSLAELGDASGLVLWESLEGLGPRALTERRRQLEELSNRAKGDAALRARALLDSVWKEVAPR